MVCMRVVFLGYHELVLDTGLSAAGGHMLLEQLPFAVSLLLGVALAATGGEFFLKGVLASAAWLRLPHLLVATTLAAFATSSPELTVSSVAALEGAPEIGLGDALGSNVVNIALIFGLALLFGPIAVQWRSLRRDMSLALLVPCLTFILALDGRLGRLDAGLLLLIFAGWLVLLVWQAWRLRANLEPCAGERPERPPLWHILVLAPLGLAALLLAGHLFVHGASGIARQLGIHSYLIGVTVVAIGTSLPELVTTLLARWRGHDEVGVGTLLGSNLFNGLAIVGTAAMIEPISAAPGDTAIALLTGVLALLLLVPGRAAILTRVRGIMLLSLYALYVGLTLYIAG